MLHHCQEQAFRPVPQKVDFIVGWAGEPAQKSLILPAQTRLIENGARSDLGQRFGQTHPTPIFRSPNLAKSL